MQFAGQLKSAKSDECICRLSVPTTTMLCYAGFIVQEWRLAWIPTPRTGTECSCMQGPEETRRRPIDDDQSAGIHYTPLVLSTYSYSNPAHRRHEGDREEGRPYHSISAAQNRLHLSLSLRSGGHGEVPLWLWLPVYACPFAL